MRNEFLDIAIRAAKLAGGVIQENLGKISKEDVHLKKASDFVTRVDKESEEVIISVIRERFPDHHFLAEESVRDVETDQYRWIIDPLDGTTNFVHGYPVFSISIALEYQKEIIIGVIFDPLRKELFTASKGRGTLLNDRPASLSPTRDMQYSLITTGFPFRKKEIIGKYLELFRNVFTRVSDLRRAGSAALDLAYLSCGRCEGFFEIGLRPWDIAAGSMMVAESRGVITDFGGGGDYIATGNIVAGTPEVHGQLLEQVRKVFAGIIEK